MGTRATGTLLPTSFPGERGWSGLEQGQRAWQAAKDSTKVRALSDISCDNSWNLLFWKSRIITGEKSQDNVSGGQDAETI